MTINIAWMASSAAQAVGSLLQGRNTRLQSGVQNQFNKDFFDYETRLNRETQRLQAENQVNTAKAIDLARREADSNPFVDDYETVRNRLFRIYVREKKPLMLLAPKWDEAVTNQANDVGGLSGMRSVISRVWNNSEWSDNFRMMDGYFKRPLRYTNRDIDIIFELLEELPILVIHGHMDGDKAYPIISTWNVVPGEPMQQIVHIRGTGHSPEAPGRFTEISFREEVAGGISEVVGLLSESYHVYVNDRWPRIDLFRNNTQFGDGPVESWFDAVADLALERQREERRRERLAVEDKKRRLKPPEHKWKDFLPPTQSLSQILKPVIEQVFTKLRPHQQDVLTYQDAISFFVKEKPDHPIKQGAMRLKRHKSGFVFQQAFLDDDNEIIRSAKSRHLVVRQVDPELLALFRESEVALVR